VKFIPYAYDGILENAIGIVGYENLCYMIYDDMELVKDIFHEIGSRIEEFYYKVLEYDEVGTILCNDDWGFNSQTMFAPDFLRELVFPYYKRIVERAHQMGKFAILHSCGYYGDIINDIVNDMKFDGRHSYEDKIRPVEEAYEELHDKIAILGGIDLNFLVRSSSEEVYKRAKKMLERAHNRGRYALGTGNSVPDFVPEENYLALMKAGLEE
jgi:uroporphyrinogen decarboxylase